MDNLPHAPAEVQVRSWLVSWFVTAPRCFVVPKTNRERGVMIIIVIGTYETIKKKEICNIILKKRVLIIRQQRREAHDR